MPDVEVFAEPPAFSAIAIVTGGGSTVTELIKMRFSTVMVLLLGTVINGKLSNGEPALTICFAAIASTTCMPFPTTWPNTVNPPFWLSRFAELSARLKNHWLVALLGSPPSLAMAIVPRRLERVGLNSLTTGGLAGML